MCCFYFLCGGVECNREYHWWSAHWLKYKYLKFAVVMVGIIDVIFAAAGIASIIFLFTNIEAIVFKFAIIASGVPVAIFVFVVGYITVKTAKTPTQNRVNFSTNGQLLTALFLFIVWSCSQIVKALGSKKHHQSLKFWIMYIDHYLYVAIVFLFMTMITNGLRVIFWRNLKMTRQLQREQTRPSNINSEYIDYITPPERSHFQV